MSIVETHGILMDDLRAYADDNEEILKELGKKVLNSTKENDDITSVRDLMEVLRGDQ